MISILLYILINSIRMFPYQKQNLSKVINSQKLISNNFQQKNKNKIFSYQKLQFLNINQFAFDQLDNKYLMSRQIINKKGPNYFSNILYSQGNLWKYGHDTDNPLSPLTVTMEPYKIKESDFMQLKEANYIWAKLFIRMSENFETIQMIHKGSNDPMIQKLLKIAKKAREAQFQKVKAVFARSDYIYNDIINVFQQTEINLISPGLWVPSQKTQQFHQLLKNLTNQNWNLYSQPGHKKIVSYYVELLKEYKRQFPQSTPYMLKIGQGNSGCAIQQIQIQKQLLKRGHILISGNFDKLLDRIVIDDNTGKLTVDGLQIGLVYYRNGYAQNHYSSEVCWKVREILQCSRAIKLPNAQMQLCNYKNVQTSLFDLSLMKKFISKDQAEKLSKFQTKFWNSQQIRKNLQQIIKQYGTRLVVKSIHEGSEQNYFYQKAHEVIRQGNPDNYCIMEFIESKSRPIKVLKMGEQFIQYNAVSEVSLYNFAIYNSTEISDNEYISYVVRTYEEGLGEVQISYGRKGVDSLAFI